LEVNSEVWRPLLDVARNQDITLLYSAHDIEHNNAVAIRSFLEKTGRRFLGCHYKQTVFKGGRKNEKNSAG
jgi:Inactive DUF488-N3 subclade